MKRAYLFLLVVLSVAVCGNAVADTIFDWYVSVRPYDRAFIEAGTRFTRASLASDLLMLSILILLMSQLIVQIANRTTGIVIAHTGFTPNQNLTSSPGTIQIVSLIPFLVTAALIAGMAKVLSKHNLGGL